MPLPKREAFIHDPLRLTLQQHGVCSSRGDKAPARMLSVCCEVLFHSGEQSNTFCFLWNVAELCLSLWKVGSSVTCPGRRLVAGQGRARGWHRRVPHRDSGFSGGGRVGVPALPSTPHSLQGKRSPSAPSVTPPAPCSVAAAQDRGCS